VTSNVSTLRKEEKHTRTYANTHAHTRMHARTKLSLFGMKYIDVVHS